MIGGGGGGLSKGYLEFCFGPNLKLGTWSLDQVEQKAHQNLPESYGSDLCQ